jgi:hypothetical protein
LQNLRKIHGADGMFFRAIPAESTPAASAAVKEKKGDEANNALASSLFGDV